MFRVGTIAVGRVSNLSRSRVAGAARNPIIHDGSARCQRVL